ncbi:MAG: type II toxin-antitoxin system VapC family toxin [Polyangiaceae bacterium]|nr:type II toxin-antitoxin system VapC family toxin [Polyangiaceae bacterium]
MIRRGDKVFVDTGAWIALAIEKDSLHGRALDTWSDLGVARARLYTSVAVVIETFTFLERNVRLDVALAWKDGLACEKRITIWDNSKKELDLAWPYFRKNFKKLSLADALNFVLMKQHGVTAAFAFDHHFANAGFRMLG